MAAPNVLERDLNLMCLAAQVDQVEVDSSFRRKENKEKLGAI